MRSLGLFLVMTKSSHSIIFSESCSQTRQVSWYAFLPLSWPFDMLGAHGAVFLRVRGDFLFLEMHFNSETRDGSFDRTARMHSVCFFSFCMARELRRSLRYIVGDVMYL